MNNLKAARKAVGMTQTEVAALVGISQNGYSYWETGKAKIDPEALAKLATIFGVSTDYLLGLTEQKTSPLTDTDEEALDSELIDRLLRLTPAELDKVDAFVQGLLAAREV